MATTPPPSSGIFSPREGLSRLLKGQAYPRGDELVKAIVFLRRADSEMPCKCFSPPITVPIDELCHKPVKAG